MAETKFTPENRAGLIERTAAGVSLPDAARDLEIRLPTVKGWITKGRKEASGPHFDFVNAMDAAREQAKADPEPMTPEEHRLKVSEVARKGSVQALKLYWEMIRADQDADETEEPANPLAAVDELAQRRNAA